MSKWTYLVLPILVCVLTGNSLANESTKLFDAVQSNNIATVKKILDRNPKLVNKTDDLKATSLHWAAEDGYLEMAKLLISRGANVNARDLNNGRPLHLAVSHNHIDITRLLIKDGALIDVRDVDDYTPLCYAVDCNYNDIAMLLIDYGAKLDAKFFAEKMTLLHMTNNTKICRKLIEKGANINSVDGAGYTPLHITASAGQLDIATLLVENGAAVNLKSDEGRTPLLMAILSNHYQMAGFLISKGADVSIGDKSGYNPLYYAISNNQLKLVELLVTHGADVNAMLPKPKIPLLECRAVKKQAAASGMSKSVKIDTQTPLAMALRLKLTDIAEYLRKHGGVE